MIGVVLWCDASDRKAVIWCEDQGDLAYISTSSDVLDRGSFFDAGDVVQFDMDVKTTLRKALNPRLVIEKAGRMLPAVLRMATREEDDPGAEASNVIPFARRTAGCPAPQSSQTAAGST
ncbi:hypothetical protein R5H30_06755 [Sulfitobacter sp. D35]|uniref:hypothetical protein n=1 Tax=Sulfitobacter sp. D35 TaxID=3083252 RepID=UPI00296F5BBA|nr:hypothetical protein [Sulfitobacter sp. D35]MDW4497674.1 hypothetical protein [Sulfitobacter sp. D35]